ncbi:MAG: hypothetical protein WCW25_03465 [Patescibacteria group bacterium]
MEKCVIIREMFDYIQKFKKLPGDVYAKLSGSEAASIIDSLEKEYGASLVKLVMLVSVKEISIEKLENYIFAEFGLSPEKSKKLSDNLKEKLFSLVKSYFYPEAESAVRQNPAVKKEEIKKELSPAKTGAQSNPAGVVVEVREKKLESAARPVQLAVMAKTQTLPAAYAKSVAVAVSGARSNKVAPFFFSAEDEEEISSLSSKVLSYLGDNRIQSEMEMTIDRVVSEFGNNFASAEAVSRLRQILKIYIQGIRNKLETKSTLMKDYRSGGMGVDEKFALVVLSAVERGGVVQGGAPGKEADRELALRPVWKPIVAPAARDMDYDLKNEIEKRKKEISKIVDKNEPPGEVITREKENKIKEELSRALKSAVGKPRLAPLTGITGDKKVTEDKPRFAEASRDKLAGEKNEVAFAPARSGGNGRKKMEDVKFTPKILTPVEELKYLDLSNFRRLYKNSPAEAAGKIMEKIALLEEEEYAKKTAGIKAWRQSPLTRLYLAIGSEAITERKPVVDIIAKRKADNKDFLSEEEIHAIMDLNRELRF